MTIVRLKLINLNNLIVGKMRSTVILARKGRYNRGVTFYDNVEHKMNDKITLNLVLWARTCGQRLIEILGVLLPL